MDSKNTKYALLTQQERADLYGPPEIDYSEIAKEEIIGKGQYGVVYKGVCRGQRVAIKAIPLKALDAAAISALKKEVVIMSQLYHPNVTLFMGACTNQINPKTGQMLNEVWIISELLEKNLFRLYMEEKFQCPLLLTLYLARDAALGIVWLHQTGVIHKDLKLENLLIDSHYNVKVCDFGLARILPKSGTIHERLAKGSPIYMAPEVMQGHDHNEKADVYSFGIVFAFMLTQNDDKYNKYSSFESLACDVCLKHVRPDVENVSSFLRNILENCWQMDPNKRPAFPDVVYALDTAILMTAIPDKTAWRWWENNFCDAGFLSINVPWDQFRNVFISSFSAQKMSMVYDTDSEASQSESEEESEEYTGELSSSIERSATMDAMHSQIVLKGVAKPVPTQVELLRGDTRTGLVSIERFGNFLGWFGGLKYPQSFFSNVATFFHSDWFHGDLTSAEAASLLAGRPPGTYLIRLSSILYDFTVSAVYNPKATMENKQNTGDIFHMRIRHEIVDSIHYFFLSNNTDSYPSVPLLLKHYESYLGLTHFCPKKSSTQNSAKQYVV